MVTVKVLLSAANKTSEMVGAVVSTENDDDVTCVAVFPAVSLTSAVNVYDDPFVSACNPAALIVTVDALLDTVLV